MVTSGSIQFGNFRANGHCTTSCAAVGQSFLDLCGTSLGTISQTVATTPGNQYTLSFRYTSRATCITPGSSASASVAVGSTTLPHITHLNEHSWNLHWQNTSYTFNATSTATSITFAATSNTCGCLLIDAVAVVPATCQAPPPPPPCSLSNLLFDGGFEANWTAPYTIVRASSGNLPGWTVTSGSIQYGSFSDPSQCVNGNCAYAGRSFLDLCADSQGSIAQNMSTTPGMLYTLTLAYVRIPFN